MSTRKHLRTKFATCDSFDVLVQYLHELEILKSVQSLCKIIMTQSQESIKMCDRQDSISMELWKFDAAQIMMSKTLAKIEEISKKIAVLKCKVDSSNVSLGGADAGAE